MKLYQYQRLFTPVKSPGEEIAAFSQQLNTIITQQYFQYQAKAFIEFPISAAEEITLDKWWMPIAQTYDKKRWQHLFPFQSAIDPNLLTQAENITLDKWFRETEVPPKTRKNWYYLWPSFEIDSRQLTLAEDPLMKWWMPAEQPQSLYTQRDFRKVYPSLFAPERQPEPRIDSWFRETQQPRFDIPREQWLYPSFFLHEEPKEITEVATIEWLTQEPERVPWAKKATPWLYPFFDIDSAILTQAENITLDKWFRETETPPKAKKNWNYLFGWFDIDANLLTQAENITLDKWFRETEHTIWDRKRQQFTYPSLFIPDRQPEARLDSWFRETQQPRFDLQREQWLMSSFFMHEEPKEITEVATVEWLTQEPELVPWAKKATPWLYPHFEIDSKILTQAENITLDKWFRETEAPPKSRENRNWLWPTFDIDASLLTKAEEIYLSKWWQPASIPRWDLKRQQFTHPSLFFPERQPEPRFDSWWTPASEPQRDHKRQQFSYPSFFMHEEPKEITEVTTVEWLFQEPEIVPWRNAAKPWLYPSFEIDSKILTQTENITLDKWFKETELPPKTRPNWNYLWPSFTVDTDQLTKAENITINKWWQPASHSVWDCRRQQHTYPVLFKPDEQPIPPLDSWFRETAQPRMDHKRWQFLYPKFAHDAQQFTQAENITMDKWFKETERPRNPVKQPYHPSLFFDPKPIAETLTVDKWFRETEVPPKALQNSPWLYPFFTTDSTALTQGETITIDKWFRETEVPPKAEHSSPWLYPFFTIDSAVLTQAEENILTKWWRETSLPPAFSKARDHRWTFPSFFMHEEPKEITEVATIEWLTQEAERTPWANRATPWLYQFFTTDSAALTQAETITLDKWFRETEQPVPSKAKPNRYWLPQWFSIDASLLTQGENITLEKWFRETEHIIWDRKRQQFTHPSLFAPDRQPEPNLDMWFRETQQPRFDVRRWQFLYPSFFLHEEPKEITEIATVEWLFEEPERVPWANKAAPHLYPHFDIDANVLTKAENITLDKWFRETEQPVPPKKRPNWYWLPSWFTIDASLLTQTESITLDKWFQPASEPKRDVRREQWLYPSLSLIERQPDPRMDAWFKETQLPQHLFTQKPRAFTYPSFFMHEEPKEITEVATVEWLFEEAEIIPWKNIARPWLYQSFTIDANALTQSEENILTKWWKETNLPPAIFRVRDQRWTYPSFFMHEEPKEVTEIETIEWLTQEPERVPWSKKAEPHLYQFFAYDPQQFTQAENITVDKWFRETEVPPKVKPAWNYLWPAFTIDWNLLTQAENVLPDKWFRETSQPTRRGPSPIPQSVFFENTAAVTETITLDKWISPEVYRRPIPRFTATLTQFFVFDSTGATAITVERWNPQIPFLGRRIHSPAATETKEAPKPVLRPFLPRLTLMGAG